MSENTPDGGRGPRISRRGFLAAAAAAGVAGTAAFLGLRHLRPQNAPLETPPATPRAAPSYAGWQDVYRERWTWDRVVRSTHFVNCWYQSHCAWNVYVKDGVVWREEQAADYPQTRPDVPDFNPRGCQKGGCFSERMYDTSRVKHPLKRVGERGSGRWQRISWEQALTEIADQMLDTMTGEGSDRIVWDLGPLFTTGAMSAAQQFLATVLDSTSLDMNTEIGDGHRGAAETFGKIVFERSADDYFFSDLILIWGGNPVYTQIPNAHFLLEARYKGAQLVCIAPDYSASAIHADQWVTVRPGTDAALALGMAHVMIEEGLYDRSFVAEQTDLPLLVREDDGNYLRRSDLEAGGSDEELYLHDPKRGIVPAPRRSLDLSGLDPSLEGRFEATLARRPHGPRPPGVHPAPREARCLFARRGVEAVWNAGASDPPARPIDRAREGGGDGHDQQLLEVLPRKPDRAEPGARLRPRRAIRQEGKRLRRVPVPHARRIREAATSGSMTPRSGSRSSRACSPASGAGRSSMAGPRR